MSSRLHKSVRSAVIIMGIGLCAATAQAANPGDVLISRYFYSNATTGFVELYNTTGSYINLSGWKIVFALSNSNIANTIQLGEVGMAPHTSVFMATDNFKALSTNATVLINGRLTGTWGTYFSTSYGQVQLQDVNGLGIDGLAYGSVSKNVFGEGSPTLSLSNTTGIVRKSISNGLQDTNDNLADFSRVASPSSSTSSVTVKNIMSPGSPTAFNGKVYIGGGDGKLYAFNAFGQSLTQLGSPVDFFHWTGSSELVFSRPCIRSIQGTPYLFLTTSRGAAARIQIDTDGTLIDSSFACYEPLTPSSTSSPVMPAVLPADDAAGGYRDYVFFTMSDASGAVLYKVRALDLRTNPRSWPVGSGTVAASSPSMNGYNLYVGVQGAGEIGLHRINPNNLDVLANLTQNHSVSSSPMVSHTAASGFFQNVPVMYVATDDGYVYARNADTGGVALSSFGEDGRLALAPGTKLSHVYLHDNILYISAYNQPIIWTVNAQTGASSVFFDGSSIPGLGTNPGIRGGVVVDPRGTVCFGTSYGWFYQIPIAHPDQPVIYKINNSPSTSGFYGTPTIDTVNGYVLAVNSNGYLYRLPRY